MDVSIREWADVVSGEASRREGEIFGSFLFFWRTKKQEQVPHCRSPLAGGGEAISLVEKEITWCAPLTRHDRLPVRGGLEMNTRLLR